MITSSEPSGAVALGAAILGRFAAEVTPRKMSHPDVDGGARKMNAEEQRELFWDIMVSFCLFDFTHKC